MYIVKQLEFINDMIIVKVDRWSPHCEEKKKQKAE